MRQIKRQNVQSVKSNTIYDCCAIYMCKITTIENVSFHNCSFREREIEIVESKNCTFLQCNFHNAEFYSCQDIQFEGGCIESLVFCLGSLHNIKKTQVKKLRFSTCNINFRCIEKISDMEALSLSAHDLSSTNIEFLQEFPNLRDLNLSATKIKNLDHLHKIPSLAKLNLSYNNSFALQEWQHLVHINNLQELNLGYTNIYNNDLDFLIDVSKLTHLYLGYTSISSSGVETLQKCSQLQKLELPHTNVCEESISFFKQMFNLKTLNVYHSKMSPEGIDSLREKMPWCCIYG